MNPLHASLYREHLDELSFLQEHRRASLEDPVFDLEDLEALDLRIEAHVDALVLGGDDALEVCAARVEEGDAGERYGAVRVYCRLDRRELAAALEPFLDPADRDAVLPVADAFCSDLPPSWAPWVAEQLERGPTPFSAILASAAARRRLPVGPAIRAAAESAPPELMEAFLGALGRLRERSATMLVYRYLQGTDHALGRAAAIAGLQIAPGSVSDQLRRAIGTFAWASVPLAISAGPEVRKEIARWLFGDEVAGLDAARALGILGDLRAIDDLLAAPDANAASAAAGLFLLTGAELFQEPAKEEDEEEAPPELASDLGVWRAWWRTHRQRFQDRLDRRHRLGEPYGADAIAKSLTSRRLPVAVRAWLGEELRLRHSTEIDYHPDASSPEQRSALAKLRASSFDASAKRAWPVIRAGSP